MKFPKYSALGNTYIVIDPSSLENITPELIIDLCSKDKGNSDGILYGPLPSAIADHALKIYNPDGSEAEKSGNGLRIFARYLHDMSLIDEVHISLETLDGVSSCTLHDNSSLITAEIGEAFFIQKKGELEINGSDYSYHSVDTGNPHCVIFSDNPTKKLACELGPQIETHPNFPHKTNVQFAQILNPNNIAIEIWERGAGHTLSSGTSSCAAAFAAHKLYNLESQIQVHMQGGIMQVDILNNDIIKLTGPVSEPSWLELDVS